MVDGDKLLELLDQLGRPDGVNEEKFQALYRPLLKQRSTASTEALKTCDRFLAKYNQASSAAQADFDTYAYTRGVFQLLMGVIYLAHSDSITWLSAYERFLKCQEEFYSQAWSYLEALALLGAAIVQHKLEHYDRALEASDNAAGKLEEVTIASDINLAALGEAIAEIRSEIQKDQDGNGTTAQSQITILPHEKALPIYNISTGARKITARRVTALNLLRRKNYEAVRPLGPDVVIVDLREWAEAKDADYILQVDSMITAPSYLRRNWLFVRDRRSTWELNGKRVATLVEDGGTTYVLLTNLIAADDHYRFQIQGHSTPIIVSHYETDQTKLNVYYFGINPTRREASEIQISGEVKGVIPRSEITRKKRRYLWYIPILDIDDFDRDVDLADKSRIMKYISLERDRPIDGEDYFAVAVKENSPLKDWFDLGSFVVFRQQGEANEGELAVCTIATQAEKICVIRKYGYQTHGKVTLWLLKASKPTDHVIVVPRPSGASSRANLYYSYKNLFSTNKAQWKDYFFEGEVTIAAVYDASLTKAVKDQPVLDQRPF